METRGKKNIYLIGSCESEIPGAKLPSYRQAFRYFLHLHKEDEKTIRDASRQTIQVISSFWAKAGIPVRAPQFSILKMEKVYTDWKGLQKHKARTTLAHKEKEDEFVTRLDDLFDIAHADALTLITVQEDRDFLLCQRQNGRPGSIGCLDKVQLLRDQRAQKRTEADAKRRKRAQEEIEASTSQVILESDSSPASSAIEENEDEDQDPPGAIGGASVTKRAKVNIMSPGLASALDRTRISSRSATFVISEVASSLGHDVNSLKINRNSIHRARASHRATTSRNLRSEFSASVPLTVHWDGKLMEDLTSKEHVDRLPVLISGVGVEQLLGVPKLSSGTGEAQAAAVISCLEKWDITDQVAALCFDTTASNTGHRSGACSIIEQKLDRDLLFLSCRHHVMELIVGAAFEKTTGASAGPEILLFKRFRDKWRFIDHTSFKPASTNSFVEAMVASSRVDILEFAKSYMEVQQPRDDYREFLELSYIFLGGVPVRGVRFQVLGAMHRARWMAKVIYAIKVWLFRSQFKMTAFEEKGVRDLATFAVLIHLKAWMTAPIAVEAPLNDFMLMGQLLKYPHATVSTATSKKLGLHLWYISEELVGLALFDSRIPPESKKLMLAAMEEIAPDHPPKRPRVESSAFLGNKGLEQFCTANSKILFHLLGLPDAFLAKDPSLWEEDESYADALERVKGLAVVNDRAERGVALIQDFNKKLTKDEEQLQFLLQVVTDHRRRFPVCTKKTIISKAKRKCE